MKEQKMTQGEIELLKVIAKEYVKEKKEAQINEAREMKEEAREHRNELKEEISNIKYRLKDYKDTKITYDTPRPVIWWPNGSNMMLGAPGWLGPNAGGFINLGFKDYSDFYSMPMDKRNKFLAEGLKIFTKIFGKDNIKITGIKTEEIENRHNKLQKELENLTVKYKKLRKNNIISTKK